MINMISDEIRLQALVCYCLIDLRTGALYLSIVEWTGDNGCSKAPHPRRGWGGFSGIKGRDA